jgi:Spx/MgsR family transcriptional regulator
MKLYGIPNCNTVKKARNWLEIHNIAYDFHDFKKLGIDEAALSDWLTQLSWEKLVNRNGMTWRGLDEHTKFQVKDNASAILLMLNKPSIIKRPVLVKDGKVLCLGFDEATYRKCFER